MKYIFYRWYTLLWLIQKEEFLWPRIYRWWQTHQFKTLTSFRSPLKTTLKVKLFLLLMMIEISFLVGLLLSFNWLIGLVTLLLVGLLPELFMLLPLFLIQLLSRIYFMMVAFKVRQTINTYPELTKIGITGSYGKTTVKEMLDEILDLAGYCLTTPLSFNTVGGIARVIFQELNERHNYFIAELAAYGRGDIRQLAQMTGVEYGILTSVGAQHLERFGSLETIVKTKFELLEALSGQRTVVNWDDENIKNKILLDSLKKRCITVSAMDAEADYFFEYENSNDFALNLKLWPRNKAWNIKIRNKKLFGTVMAYNVALAAVMAKILKIPDDIIIIGLERYQPNNHRMSLQKLGKTILIENTYSSNQRSFNQLIKDLETMIGRKALITPGIVELGDMETSIHTDLGQMAAKVFETVVLVGRTSRTKAFEQGLLRSPTPPQIQYIEPIMSEYQQTLAELQKKHALILWENDVPEHYF